MTFTQIFMMVMQVIFGWCFVSALAGLVWVVWCGGPDKTVFKEKVKRIDIYL